MKKTDLTVLDDLVRRDEVDTIVTVFPDIFGRFMGKRITGHFFLEEVAKGGMHACDYLLVCDVEMDPVPGYQFASRSTGYGDVHAARTEVRKFNESVTCWERNRHFERT